MAKFVGTDTIPNVPSLPASGVPGQIVYNTNDDIYYAWDNSEARWKHLGGSVSQLGTIPSCKAYPSANVSLPNTATTGIPLNTEMWDTDGIHDNVTNNTRLTCRTAGIYLVEGAIWFTGSAAGTQRIMNILVNGAIINDQQNPAGTADARLELSCLVKLNVGDYVELAGYQDSGVTMSALATTPAGRGTYLSMVWVGAGNGVVGQQAVPAARIAATATQSLPVGTTIRTYNTARFDTDNIWSASTPTRLTCKTPGVYTITGHIEFTASTPLTGYVQIYLRKNGVADAYLASQFIPQGGYGGTVTTTTQLAAGDYIEFAIANQSGSTLTAQVLAGNYQHTADFEMVFSGQTTAVIPHAHVQRATATTMTLPGPYQVPWDTVISDNDAMYSGSAPTRLTCKTAGVYSITAGIVPQGPPAGQYQLRLKKNGAEMISFYSANAGTQPFYEMGFVSATSEMAIGDYVEFELASNATGTWGIANTSGVNYRTRMTMTKIGLSTSGSGSSGTYIYIPINNVAGPATTTNPVIEGTFTPKGGRCYARCYASGYRNATGKGQLVVKRGGSGGTNVGWIIVYFNQVTSHAALVPMVADLGVLPAGVTQTIGFYNYDSSLTVDNSDMFTIEITEVPQ